MTLKRFIVCWLAGLSMLPLRAQTDDSTLPPAGLDSLLTVVESMPHDSVRLRRLLDITLQLYIADTERCTKFNELLIEQASEQQSVSLLCQAYFTKIVMAYNTYDQETVQKTLEIMAPIARKAKLYDELFRAWRCAIEIKVLTQDFESCESESQKMLREAESLNNKVGIIEAYQCLSNIYRLTFRRQLALELLEKALPQAQELGRKATISNILRSMIFLYQSPTSRTDPVKWHHTLDTFEQFLLEESSSRSLDPTFLVLYGNYIEYYLHIDQLENARQIIERANKLYYPSVVSPIHRISYDVPCSRYFRRTKEYDKALEKIDVALADMVTMGMGADYNNLLYEKAELLDHMGRWDEALPLYKQTTSFIDSLHVETINKQYEQIKQNFNAGQLELERANLQHRTQIVTLILLGLGLLVVVYLVIYLLRNRNALRKAEEQMRQMAEKMEQINEAKDRFLSNISVTIRTPLNTVVDGSLRLAMQQVEDPAERQQLSATIRRMSSGLLNMINDILDLSRLEAGMMKFDPTEMEISSQILDAATSAKKPVDIRIEYPADTLYMINFDALRLRQLLGSLFEEQDKADNQIVATICEHDPRLTLTVKGTILARENPTQEIIIRNEINRMLTTHFGGLYAIRRIGTEQVVVISLPVEPIRPEKEKSNRSH